MSSRVFRRRSATAAWIYAAVACGIAGTIVAARVLRPRRLRRVRDGARGRGLLPDPPRPHGRGVAHEVRLPLRRRPGLGTAAAAVPPGAAAQGRRRSARHARSSSRSRRSPTSSSARTASSQALLAAALLPLVQSSENVGVDGAAPAQPLRPSRRVPGRIGRASPARDRDRRAARRDGGARRDRRRAGHRDRRHLVRRARRAASVPVGAPRESSARTSRGSARSCSQSSIATGVISLRTTLVPLVLGVVSGTTQVGLFRIAQTPQTGLAAASSPARLDAHDRADARLGEGRARAHPRRDPQLHEVGRGADARRGARVLHRDAVARRARLRLGVRRRRDCRPRRPPRRRDPLRARLDEVAARSRSAGRGCGSSRTASRRSSRSRSSPCSGRSGARRARRSPCSPRRSCSPPPGSS